MGAGLECFTADSRLSLSIGDRLTRFESGGVATFPSSTPGASVFVPVAGMTPDGTWLVTVTDTNELEVVNGGFFIYLYVMFPNAPAFYRKAPWVVYRC